MMMGQVRQSRRRSHFLAVESFRSLAPMLSKSDPPWQI
jgi:hypothetical protein